MCGRTSVRGGLDDKPNNEGSSHMRRIAHTLITLAAFLALAAPSFAATRANAATRTLTGTVGPGFVITMNTPGGRRTTNLTVTPGTYVITIHDLSSIHNFHLSGSGINKLTSVPATGTTKWTVKLAKGTYHFVCDPHRTIMHGILRVT
jgi:plastocyanin